MIHGPQCKSPNLVASHHFPLWLPHDIREGKVSTCDILKYASREDIREDFRDNFSIAMNWKLHENIHGNNHGFVNISVKIFVNI